jgi:hypothetical protein
MFTARERTVLRLAPLWTLSAVVGRQRFDALELAAFWRCVERAAQGWSGLAHEVLMSLLEDPDQIVVDYRHERTPVASGLVAVTTVLDRVPLGESLAFRRLLLMEIAEGVARARGPFGATISRADAIATELVAVLLGLEAETSGPWIVLDAV